jgi:pimeloyl-ACP methyl ester carboxylesterase
LAPKITGSELVISERAGHALIQARPDELIRLTEEFLAA